MSEETFTLMAVSKMLFSIEGQASDVRVTFHDSRYGPMVVSLDARMHGVQLATNQDGQPTISWRTLEMRKQDMSSKKTVTSPKFMILSSKAEELDQMQWELGQKFIVNQASLYQLERGLQEVLNDKVILELESYQLDVEGKICYDVRGELLSGQVLRWLLTPDEMIGFLQPIPDGVERFLLIDD
jgi:hypothetical protein